MSGPAAGRQIEIPDEFQIGRAAPEEGRLGDDPELSRAHAKVTRNPQGQLVIEDLGSTNGTAVNGQRIAGPTVLNPGDTVQLGKTTLQLQDEGGLQATALGGAAGAGAAAAAPPPAPPTAPTTPLAAAGGPPGPGAPPPPPPPPGGGPGGPLGGRPQPAGPSGGGSRKGLFIGLGALAAVAAVVVAVLLLTGGDDSADAYAEDLEAVSAPLEEAQSDLRAVTATSAIAEDETAYQSAVDSVEEAQDALEDLEPSEDLQDEHDELVDTVDELHERVETGAEGTRTVEIAGESRELINDALSIIAEARGEEFEPEDEPDEEAAATETTPTETTPTETQEEDPVRQQRRTEAIATLQALIDAVQDNDEAVFCGLLSPRQAQRLVGGPGGDAAIARCVEVAEDVDLSENVPSSIDVTGVRISGNQASVRLTTGERFTLVRRGGRYVINSGLG